LVVVEALRAPPYSRELCARLRDLPRGEDSVVLAIVGRDLTAGSPRGELEAGAHDFIPGPRRGRCSRRG